MAEENKYGKTTPSIKATGSMTEPMEEADSSMPMETSIKASGKMIRLMVKESILKMMVLVIQENGLKIYSMDLVSKDGLIVHPTRGISYLIQ